MTAPTALDLRATPVDVPAYDGVTLATDVYLPEQQEDLDAVLIRLPYDKCGRYTFIPQIAAYLNDHGFAVVAQDVRGKFRSGGQPDPFVNEAADGAATLDWISGQPWSTGRAGMLGDSYYGFTQWAAASTGHPALKAIVPRVTGTALAEVLSASSVPRIPFYEWIVQTFSQALGLDDPLATTADTTLHLPADPDRITRIIHELEVRVGEGTFIESVFGGPRPSEVIDVPALHVGGWWDNLQHAQLLDWSLAASSPAAEHQFLRMNASDHEDFELKPEERERRRHHEDDDELAAYLPRMLDEPISFLRHYVSGHTDRWDAPTVRFKVAHDDWRSATSWPPPVVRGTTFHLGDGPDATQSRAGGSLSTTPELDAEPARWTHDPRQPVPSPIADDWGILFDLPDESALHERDDVPTFTSQPLIEDLDILGPVTAQIAAGSSGGSGHVIVRLLDVDPSGAAYLIREGAAIAETSPDAPHTTVDLGHTAYRVRAGHRLRLAISSSLFPLYALGPVSETLTLGSPVASQSAWLDPSRSSLTFGAAD